MQSQNIPSGLSPFVSNFTDIQSIRNEQQNYVPYEHLGHDDKGNVIEIRGPYSHADGGITVAPVLATNQPNEEPVAPAVTPPSASPSEISVIETQASTDFTELKAVPNISYYAIGGAVVGLLAGKIFHLPMIWSAILVSASASYYAFYKNGGTWSQLTSQPATPAITASIPSATINTPVGQVTTNSINV
jgi:hypothetical protein